MADRPGGHDAPLWLLWLVVAGATVIAVSLLVLRVDLRHDQPGGPPPAVIIVGTPTTYGPPMGPQRPAPPKKTIPPPAPKPK